jgi:hypothetical protein
MKIAYLVLSHDNPTHLNRLIRACSSGSSAFFVHIDRKSRMNEFVNVRGENVHFSRKRIPIYWADYSIVEASLLLMQDALADQRRFDYYLLLSGADYPLQPVSYIENFFKRNNGKEFINMVRMPNDAAGKPISRLTRYTPRHDSTWTGKIKRKLLQRTGLLPTERDYIKALGSLIPYAGSTWWALTREACGYIRDYVAEQPGVVDFFKDVFCPDESFFQTIIGNSPYGPRIQRNLTYTDWSSGGPHPASITDKHLQFFREKATVRTSDVYGEGELLFARKFSDKSEDVVRRIDHIREEKEKGHQSEICGRSSAMQSIGI